MKRHPYLQAKGQKYKGIEWQFDDLGQDKNQWQIVKEMYRQKRLQTTEIINLKSRGDLSLCFMNRLLDYRYRLVQGELKQEHYLNPLAKQVFKTCPPQSRL